MKDKSRYHIRVKDLAKEEKPREKLMAHGAAALSAAELLAVVLGTGSGGEDVLQMSSRVLKDYGSRAVAQETRPQHLMDSLGIPRVKACQLVACFELGRRFAQPDAGVYPAIRSPEDVYDYVRDDMRGLRKEQFRGLYLNTRNKLVHDEVITVGTATANLVHPREVFQPALEHLAAAIIVVHNHPSGDPSASEDDISITRRLAEVARVMDIDFLDHVIVGKKGFVSLKQQGIL